MFSRKWHVPHVAPVPCVCFFSVLAPADRGGGRCLDTFSTMRYPSSNSLQSWFRVAVYSLSDWHLAGLPGDQTGLQKSFAGLPGGPAASFANKLWDNCHKIWSQTAELQEAVEGGRKTLQLCEEHKAWPQMMWTNYKSCWSQNGSAWLSKLGETELRLLMVLCQASLWTGNSSLSPLETSCSSWWSAGKDPRKLLVT